MIKLKSLIREVMFKWSTAHHKNKVPDEVIDLVHKIIAVAHKDDPDTHPEWWVSIKQRPEIGNSLMNVDHVQKDVWYIDKPGKHNKKKYWILEFNDTKKKWYLVSILNNKINRKLDIVGNVDNLIKHWVKDDPKKLNV